LFLTYHSVSENLKYYPYNTAPAALAQQVSFLRKEFTIISIEEARRQVTTRVEQTGQIVITFDDGYASVFDTVFPMFKEMNVPFGVFVSTSLASSGYKAYCGWSQLGEMSAHPLVTIGSHGINHIGFDSIDLADVSHELKESRSAIEARIQQKILFFAYPYGYSNTEIESLCAKNYEMGFINHNEIFRGDNFRVPRISVTSSHSELDAFINLISRSMFISTTAQ
jgi:peptidoglycan/xylan/chitin deacetylase (PgdA/CDA1 family)